MQLKAGCAQQRLLKSTKFILVNLHINYILHAGFEVAEILTLLDRFCEEKLFIEDLEKEVESGKL